MNTLKLLKEQAFNCRSKVLTLILAFGIILYLDAVKGYGQGTLTLTFEGQPPGTMSQASYSAFGMQFHAVPFGALYLSGGGVAPHPDNGTGYLLIPENGSPNGGLTLSAPFLFNLNSFAAAQYWDPSATNFTVIGYKPMAGTVTNTFAAQVSTWDTFYLDSSFENLFRVDIYASSYWGQFSLDNVIISGVPEPSSGTLVLLGIGSAIGWSRVRKRSSPHQHRH